MEQIRVEEGGMRIDRRLTTQFPYSRNFFHRLLDTDLIHVSNDQRPLFTPKKSYTLQTNDIVVINSFMRYIDGDILDETPQRTLDIRHETDDYLVIRKPK